MADALHNTNDAAALGIAYIARKISKKQADERFTFGYRRAELIGAMIQLTALILVGLFLVYQAIHRLFEPQPLEGSWIMATALIAIVIDVATAWLLWAMAKGSLNVKAAFMHNLTDAAASFAVLLGGAAVYWLDWSWVDPALTLLIAGYILKMSFTLLRQTSAILMEGKPDDIDLSELERAVEALPGVEDIHHIHVWELDESCRALEAHIVTDGEVTKLKAQVKQLLKARFSIAHSTLEFETAAEACTERNCRESAHAHSH